MAPISTPEEFTGRYGYPPQTYFDKCVRGDADPPDLPSLEFQLAEAERKMAETAGWETSQDIVVLTEGAHWETEVNSLKILIRARLWHRDGARAFLAGEIPDFLPYLGPEGRWLVDQGWIDTTKVPA